MPTGVSVMCNRPVLNVLMWACQPGKGAWVHGNDWHRRAHSCRGGGSPLYPTAHHSLGTKQCIFDTYSFICWWSTGARNELVLTRRSTWQCAGGRAPSCGTWRVWPVDPSPCRTCCMAQSPGALKAGAGLCSLGPGACGLGRGAQPAPDISGHPRLWPAGPTAGA